MKERPILMRGEMVRATLAGLKTQTRRIVKPQPTLGMIPYVEDKTGILHCRAASGLDHHAWDWLWCPYGKPGDRLWVRETWRSASKEHPRVRIEYKADGSSWGNADTEDGPDQKVLPSTARPFSKDHWKPSIHIPRWACRITLEVVSVRVERLQDISEADAEAEGVIETDEHRAMASREQLADRSLSYAPSVVAYRELWESINGAGSWAKNPWAWVITFKRL
jgi:hypothetical protein